MGEIISAIIGISYFVLGYWSVGETIYANKVIIGRIGDMWIQRNWGNVWLDFNSGSFD